MSDDRLGFDRLDRQFVEEHLRDASGSAWKVFLALRSMRNSENYCWPSVEGLAAISGMSSSTVKQALAELVNLAWIGVEVHARRGSVVRHGYRILTEPKTTPVIDDRAENHPGTEPKTTPVEASPSRISSRHRAEFRLQSKAIKEKTNTEAQGSMFPTAKNNSTFELPDWIPAALWQDFVEMRREKKKELTIGAAKIILLKLERMRANGHDPMQSLENSIMHGWTGVFEPKTPSQAVTTGQAAPTPAKQPRDPRSWYSGNEYKRQEGIA